MKINVILGVIFYNRQANNYRTSPVSITLNILRICEESQVAFHYCTDLILVVTYTICRDVLRTQTNIYDGVFFRQCVVFNQVGDGGRPDRNTNLRAIAYYLKKKKCRIDLRRKIAK